MRAQDPRALIRYALAGLALTTMLLWAAYLVRGALLLIYIAALVAIGLSPVVTRLERRRLRGTKPLPRWVAILEVYLLLVVMIVIFTVLVVPPLIEQARGFWNAIPDLLERAQTWLMERGVLAQELSLGAAIQQAAGSSGADAVSTIVGAISGFVGGVFGFLTILILAFYLLLDSRALFRHFIALFPKGERERVEDASRRISSKVSAWLAGQLLLGAMIGTTSTCSPSLPPSAR